MSALENATTFRPVFDFEKASQPKRQTELCVRETRWTMENLAKLHADLQSESICLRLVDTTDTRTQPQTLANRLGGIKSRSSKNFYLLALAADVLPKACKAVGPEVKW